MSHAEFTNRCEAPWPVSAHSRSVARLLYKPVGRVCTRTLRLDRKRTVPAPFPSSVSSLRAQSCTRGRSLALVAAMPGQCVRRCAWGANPVNKPRLDDRLPPVRRRRLLFRHRRGPWTVARAKQGTSPKSEQASWARTGGRSGLTKRAAN